MLTTSNLREKKADMEVIVKYIKNDIYPKVKFCYKVQEALMVGGLIYNDFEESCKGQTGDHNMTGETRAIYMEAAWNACLRHYVQKRALSSKRSGVYTVMQNIFLDKLECDEGLTRCKQQYVLTNQYDIKIHVTFVLISNASYCPLKV
jgi:hypothetical protein